MTAFDIINFFIVFENVLVNLVLIGWKKNKLGKFLFL